MQNLRTRTQNDVTSAKKYAGSEFAKSMLEVADNLSFAIKAATPDATDSNPKLKTFFEGVSMTQHALIKAFAANDVFMYKSLGEKFDPNIHMGLYQFEDSTKEPGTVGNVVKEGYKLSDRVLRAAQVGTIKAPSVAQPPGNAPEGEPTEPQVNRPKVPEQEPTKEQGNAPEGEPTEPQVSLHKVSPEQEPTKEQGNTPEEEPTKPQSS